MSFLQDNNLMNISRRTLFLRCLVFTIPVLVVGIALSYAHFDIAREGEDYKGAIVLIDRLFDLSLAAAITAVAFCVGRKAARLLSLTFANGAEELSFSVMIGVGIIGLAVLGLGLAGLLTSIPVILLFVLLIFLSWREAARLFTLLKEGIVNATATKLRLTLTVLFAALLVIFAIRAMTPPHTPDEAIYHLAVTKLFVQQGRVFPVVDNWAGNMPFLIQMIYAVCLIVKADIAAKLFSLGLAVICSLALYGFCHRFLTRRAGVVALFGFFATGMVVEVAITARVDVSLAGMLFLAAYAMMIYLQTRERGWFYASAMLAGFSIGIKYSAGIYILLLAVMYLTESFLRRQPVIDVIKRGLIYTAIVAAIASPWFIKNFVWFGNPVYPFITGEVAELAPGQRRYFNAEDQLKLDAHFDAARKEMPSLVRSREIEMARAEERGVKRHPLRFWEYFTKPDIYNMAEEFHYPNYLFLFAPLMIFAGKNRWLLWLAFFSAAFFVASIQASWIARLLLPIYPALTLISAYAITELAARADWGEWLRPRRRLATMIPAIAVAAVLVPTAVLSVAQSINTDDLSFIKGDLSRADYMNKFYYYPPSYFINHSTPENSRVMMIGAQTSYDLNRDYVADVNWDSTEWRRRLIHNDSVEELHEDLKQNGITHVWVAYGLFTFVAEMGRENYPNISGLPPPANPDYKTQLMNWATLDLYSSRYLQPVYNDRYGSVVYKIK
jgi:4-amino-4-deoxy-L-arabinose transferase-like glycosyltransferase